MSNKVATRKEVIEALKRGDSILEWYNPYTNLRLRDADKTIRWDTFHYLLRNHAIVVFRNATSFRSWVWNTRKMGKS